MKKTLIAFFIILSVSFSSADNLKNTPKFTDFPVTSSYIGKTAPVVLKKNDQDYRTRIRNALKQPVNFAGEYVLSTWGCGTSCLMGVIVSKKTGKVIWLPGTVCCWKGEGERLLFKLNSRLLVTAGIMNEESEHGAHFYAFTGKEFKHLKTVPVKSTENQTSSGIKQPQGWDVQYVDASCIVTTHAEGETKETPWRIKMGHLAGNQLILMFSVYNSSLKGLTIPEDIKAFFVVDDKSYEAIGINNQSGELVLPVENSIKLQGSLSSAKSVGIKVQINNDKPVKIAGFDLKNIPEARVWLQTCNLIGVGALPK